MNKTRTPKAFGQLMLAAAAALFLLPSALANVRERIDTLGKDTLGESVKEFRTRYPKAICGRTDSLEINPRTLVNSGNMDSTHCCLNDRTSLTELSQFTILNLDDCAVHAAFWKNKLIQIDYMLDVRSIQTVLLPFERLYGPPAQIGKDPDNDTVLTLVDWMQGGTTLEIRLTRLRGEVTKKSTETIGEPWLKTVTVSLWKIHSLAST
jgi:hypothetical protein